MFNSKKKEVLLPTSEESLDQFVEEITKEYNLPAGDDTYDAIATMIMHLPSHKAFAPKSFFGHGVLRSMANKAAFTRLREFAIKRKEAEEEAKAKLTVVPSESKDDAITDVKPIQNA